MDAQRIRVISRIIGVLVIVVLFWLLHLMYRQMQMIQREKARGGGRQLVPSASKEPERFGPRQIEVKPYVPPPAGEESEAAPEEPVPEEAAPEEEESQGGDTGG